MKHYILLSVEIPEPGSEQHGDWLTLKHWLESLAKTFEGIAQLGEGVWLLPRDEGMTFAAECIARARTSSLKVSTRFLSSDDEASS